MTLKQQEVMRQLPLTRLNMAEAMRKAGYSPASCRSGTNYARLRKIVDKAYDPDQVKADIRKAEKDFIKSNDNSNRARMLELRAKIANCIPKDSIQQVNAVFGDVLKDLPDIVKDNTKGSNNTHTQGIDTQADTSSSL